MIDQHSTVHNLKVEAKVYMTQMCGHSLEICLSFYCKKKNSTSVKLNLEQLWSSYEQQYSSPATGSMFACTSGCVFKIIALLEIQALFQSQVIYSFVRLSAITTL